MALLPNWAGWLCHCHGKYGLSLSFCKLRLQAKILPLELQLYLWARACQLDTTDPPKMVLIRCALGALWAVSPAWAEAVNLQESILKVRRERHYLALPCLLLQILLLCFGWLVLPVHWDDGLEVWPTKRLINRFFALSQEISGLIQFSCVVTSSRELLQRSTEKGGAGLLLSVAACPQVRLDVLWKCTVVGPGQQNPSPSQRETGL